MITSGGNRNQANADFGGKHGCGRIDSFTDQACVDLANAQRNGAGAIPPLPVWAGEAIDLITDLPSAADLDLTLATQAEDVLAKAGRLTDSFPQQARLTSPARPRVKAAKPENCRSWSPP
jgi:hypothetical protein